MTAAALAESTGQARRILIVDDNIDNVRSLAMLFQSMGHDVGYAMNASAAIALAADMKPDIVFLDLLLPDDHGAGVCTELRKLADLAGTAIIGVTGSTRMLDLQVALDAGCDDVLRKPVPPRVYERLLAGGATRHSLREVSYHRRSHEKRLVETDELLREMERLKLRANALLREHRATVETIKQVQEKLEATQPIDPADRPLKDDGTR